MSFGLQNPLVDELADVVNFLRHAFVSANSLMGKTLYARFVDAGGLDIIAQLFDIHIADPGTLVVDIVALFSALLSFDYVPDTGREMLAQVMRTLRIRIFCVRSRNFG